MMKWGDRGREERADTRLGLNLIPIQLWMVVWS